MRKLILGFSLFGTMFHSLLPLQALKLIQSIGLKLFNVQVEAAFIDADLMEVKLVLFQVNYTAMKWVGLDKKLAAFSGPLIY